MARAKGKHEAPKKPGAERKISIRSRAVIVISAVLAALCAVFFASALVISKSDTIHPNISLNGVDLGGKTVLEAVSALNDNGWADSQLAEVKVTLPGGYGFSVSAVDGDFFLSADQAAQAAYSYGHSGGLFKDVGAYIKCLRGAVSERDILSGDDREAGILKIVSEALAEYDAMLKAGYTIDTAKNELAVIKGAESIRFDETELIGYVIEAFTEGKSEIKLNAPKDAQYVSMQSIRDEIYKVPVSAAFDAKAHRITPSSDGVDFDAKAAQELFDAAAPGELIIIPLTITKPAISTDNIGTELFADKLGAQTTVYHSSTEGRATNVELSAARINGVVLNPGEVFSFNDVVGRRTAEGGYKTATAYAGGEVIEEIGGGICQTSSTLYCAALFANLEIVARDCHGFAVSYVPYGLDATVSWGGPEFKFRNDRDYPVKIVSKTENHELTVEIWGTDVDGTYVKMESASKTRRDSKYNVAIGTDAVSYRCVYDKDGNLLSRTLEATSYYSYHKEDILWPESPTTTAKHSKTPKPTETPTPAESIMPPQGKTPQ